MSSAKWRLPPRGSLWLVARASSDPRVPCPVFKGWRGAIFKGRWCAIAHQISLAPYLAATLVLSETSVMAKIITFAAISHETGTGFTSISGPLFRTLPTSGLASCISIASASNGRSRSSCSRFVSCRSSASAAPSRSLRKHYAGASNSLTKPLIKSNPSIVDQPRLTVFTFGVG